MTESMKYYESIRRKYPETVSKDQFYQIAHISKATALHLLQNGLGGEKAYDCKPQSGAN